MTLIPHQTHWVLWRKWTPTEHNEAICIDTRTFGCIIGCSPFSPKAIKSFVIKTVRWRYFALQKCGRFLNRKVWKLHLHFVSQKSLLGWWWMANTLIGGDLVRKTIGSTVVSECNYCCRLLLTLHLYLAIDPFNHSPVNWKLLCGFCPKFPTGFLDWLFRFSHSIDLLDLASFWQNSHLGKVDSLENSYPLNSRTWVA